MTQFKVTHLHKISKTHIIAVTKPELTNALVSLVDEATSSEGNAFRVSQEFVVSFSFREICGSKLELVLCVCAVLRNRVLA